VLKWFKTLRAKFLVVLLVPVVIATVVATIVFGIQTYLDLKNAMFAKKENLAELNAELLKTPMWNFDPAHVERLAVSISADADVASVIVRNDQGTIITQVGEPKPFLVVRKDIVQVGLTQTYTLGQLEISFHLNAIQDAITKQIVQNSLLLVSLVVVILISAVFANRWIVDRPLRRLLQSIQATEESGRRKSVDWSSNDEIGTVITAYNTMQDRLNAEEIERQRSEKKLMDSEERFRLLAELSIEGLIINHKGEVHDFNPSIVKMFGYTNEEFKAITPATIVAEQSLPTVMDHIQNDKEEPYEVVGVKKDGSEFPIEIQARMIEIDGELLRVTCIQDITERKLSEYRRDTNSRRLNLLLDLNREASVLDEPELLKRSLDIAVSITNSRIGYLHIVNDDQRTLSLSTWNDAARALCTAEYDTHYPVDQAGIWADAIRLKHPVVHNDYPSIEDKPGYPAGHFPVIRHMSTPVMDGAEVRLIIGVGNKTDEYDDFDVEQLQMVANEIQKFVMRRRVELSLELKTAELTAATEDAEKANQAKSELLAAMSHDFRTPLNAIMGFSDMMRERAFGPLGDPRYEGYVDDIHSSGSLLVSLINDVLDLSKIEAGKYELAAEEINMQALINVSMRQLSALAAMSNLTLTSDIPDDLPHMVGDERALVQVLNNLVSNAVKFTPEGGLVCVSAELNGDGGISVQVKDTGIGMSEEGVTKALRPFEQIDGMKSRQHEGTGLGLHLCANFMSLFGGSMDIDSMVDHGTTVSLHFPSERTIDLQ
jgi:PAS domain S-box-containing protein